ncbi:MAG: hypothetical protein R3C12_20505 [Planctomycetaceae bacterium]
MSIGLRPGYFAANYLGNQYDSFQTNGDPNRPNFAVDNLALPANTTLSRLEDRRGLRAAFDTLASRLINREPLEAMDRFDQMAYELVTGDRARKALILMPRRPLSATNMADTPGGNVPAGAAPG